MSENRTAIVTGAASGIGAATAKELAARGYRVACLDKNGKGAKTVTAALPAVDAGAHFAFEVDVADEPALVEAFADGGRATWARSTRSSPAPASPT